MRAADSIVTPCDARASRRNGYMVSAVESPTRRIRCGGAGCCCGAASAGTAWRATSVTHDSTKPRRTIIRRERRAHRTAERRAPDGTLVLVAFPEHRPRRLRRTPALRRLVGEARVDLDDLVAPLFVKEGIDAPEPVPSMPGVLQHTQESLRKEVRALADLGIPAVVLFGVPAVKDATGSGADAPDGVVQVALRSLRDEVGDDLVFIADNCLDEYTNHGHCGVVSDDGEVDNDATIERYAEIAVSQADAGADVVAPSGMMDGQVGAIRAALDSASHNSTAILAYSAKYASALYGPFRDAAECAPQFGDRRGYQMDPRNAREAVDETALDVAEGADMVMVKPAAQIGWLDGDAVAFEHLVAIKRAGADFVLTYFAREVAERLHA